MPINEPSDTSRSSERGSTMDEGGLVHREVFELRATPEQVRRFIVTPERIMDYNPPAIEAGMLEEAHSVWFRTSQSVTMVERIEDECTDECVVVRATVAPGLAAPPTAEAVRSAATITLFEDWEIQATELGAMVTKSWRDARAFIELPYSLDEAIRETAKAEGPALVENWNAAAQRET